MTHESPEQLARRLESDVRETVAMIYGPLQRQASDGAAIVALALFISTIALFASIVAN
jgi:hypothetical protein